MTKKIFLASILLITSCANLHTETKAQALYLAVSKYKLIQESALEYKKECELNKLVDKDCDKVVVKIAKIDREANFLINKIDGENLDSVTNEAVRASLLELTNKLSTYLIKE